MGYNGGSASRAEMLGVAPGVQGSTTTMLKVVCAALPSAVEGLNSLYWPCCLPWRLHSRRAGQCPAGRPGESQMAQQD